MCSNKDGKMNERIQKLAEQSGLEYNFDPMTWLKYEKFAGIVTGKQIGRASCRERVSAPV